MDEYVLRVKVLELEAQLNRWFIEIEYICIIGEPDSSLYITEMGLKKYMTILVNRIKEVHDNTSYR